jgi:hypothetical protein
MIRKKTLWKIIIILLSALPIMGCITMSYLFDFDPNGLSKGTIFHEITTPFKGNEDQISFDSYIQGLHDQGWENIEIGKTEDGLLQLTATYDFDLPAGRGLPEDLQKSITITSEEAESGDVLTTFAADLDFSQLQNSWDEVVNSAEGDATIDLGKWLGGIKAEITKEEMDELIEEFGEPAVFFDVRLPGNKPLDVVGPWSNADDYMAGKADIITFEWIVDQNPQINLYVASLTTEEEEQPTPEPTEVPFAGMDIDEDKLGMPCDEYCLSLDPIGLWLNGETYPDCICDCGLGNTYVNMDCVPNVSLCDVEGVRLHQYRDGGSVCVCTDPTKKFDIATQSCINLDGSECNLGNGCEFQNGENCNNCTDCGCTFGSPQNNIYNQYLSCNPSSDRADIYGCVFDIPDKTEQLSIMKEEHDRCTDAFGLMNLAEVFKGNKLLNRNSLMMQLNKLPDVETWQKKSGCVPTSDGFVTGREAVDPMICLLRYCDRIKVGVQELERQISGQIAVFEGPGIKINPPGTNINFINGQIPNLTDRINIYGDRPATLISPLGAGTAHSAYEVDYDPETGMTITLYEGSYTHSYIDPESGNAIQVEITSGEQLTIDKSGIPIDQQNFDPNAIDPWWENVEYVVECPENSTQLGPDCFCDAGFDVDIELGRCLPNGKDQATPTKENTVVDTIYDIDNSNTLMIIGLVCCCCSILIIIIVLAIFLIRRKKKNKEPEVLDPQAPLPPAS